ncbi:MAG: GNAT family protein [Parasphingorhabdus sp.]|uniref:GNAT family N-acetyltransferase n=1 Tax=Parasphingorhabdus sp. TaxID=2709688 RepID=UPI003001ED44
MAKTDAPLDIALIDGDVRIIPFEANHLPHVRAACAKDTEIWDIYPVNMLDDDFDAQLKSFHGEDGWVRFTVFNGDQVVGTTSYIHPSLENGTVMIGGTYIEPSVRGSDFNRRMKKLMIDHAFASGFWRIEFTVDARNKRSMAAVLKLGAKHEGTLRRNRKTWTGYVRDTAVFGLLKEEWVG